LQDQLVKEKVAWMNQLSKVEEGERKEVKMIETKSKH